MKMIACYSSKGGVGKTATAVNLAWWCAARGRATLLADLDPQGASSFYFRVNPAKKNWGKILRGRQAELGDQIRASEYPNLDVLPAHQGFRNVDVLLAAAEQSHKRLKHSLGTLESHYDLVILDCPPTMGPLAEAIFHAADRILLPVIPTTLAERSLEQLLDFFAQQGWKTKAIRPFFNMVQGRKTLHRDTIARLRARVPHLAQATVPHARDVEYMGEQQAPLLATTPHCAAALAFDAVFSEHCGKLVQTLA
jgi:chromosome partitioning protein